MVGRTGNPNDDNKNSFINDGNGNVARNVTFGGSINATPSGLQNDFLVTTMNVSDTATQIPASPLTDRNAISIQNLDTIETLYVGKLNVTADSVVGTTSGWEVGAGETLNLSCKDTIIFYGRCQAGKTVMVKVFEVS